MTRFHKMLHPDPEISFHAVVSYKSRKETQLALFGSFKSHLLISFGLFGFRVVLRCSVCYWKRHLPLLYLQEQIWSPSEVTDPLWNSCGLYPHIHLGHLLQCRYSLRCVMRGSAHCSSVEELLGGEEQEASASSAPESFGV